MLPCVVEKEMIADLAVGDFIHIPQIRPAIQSGEEKIAAFIVREGNRTPLELKLEGLSPEDREIILAGCLMNYYAKK